MKEWRSEQQIQEDIEANYFARCLLMPREFIEPEIERDDFNGCDEQVIALAKKFQVEIVQMVIRIKELIDERVAREKAEL